jgi:hypothetical protein
MDRLAATFLLLPGLLACASSREVAPEDLVETFETSVSATEVWQTAVDILRSERFSISQDDEHVVRAERRRCWTQPPGTGVGSGVQHCTSTVAVITLRTAQTVTQVTVHTSSEPRSRSPSSEEAHWCKTITAKLKEALGVKEG